MTTIWIIVFVVSLYVLSKASDHFTDASEKIGTILKVPSFVVGVLVVALGTSIPELATSIFGILRGEAGILSANVTGSTIANIFLGLGFVVVISRRVAKFNWDSVSNDMPFIFGSALLLAIAIYDGIFNFYEAIIFLIGYAIYIVYSLKIRKMSSKEVKNDLNREIKSKLKEDFKKDDLEHLKVKKNNRKGIFKIILIFIFSLAAIIASANYTVDSLIMLATIFGLGTPVLAATFVAIGTSLPEISVGISAAKKGNFDMVLGNIMGSNIFNILVVFGLVGLFTDIPVPNEVIYFILPVMIGAILMQWLVTLDKKITTTEGYFMTLLYVVFVAKLFGIF